MSDDEKFHTWTDVIQGDLSLVDFIVEHEARTWGEVSGSASDTPSPSRPASPTGTTTPTRAARESGVPRHIVDAMKAGMARDSMSAYEKVMATLFPAGIPPSQGVEGGLGRFLNESRPHGKFVDPETGAIHYDSGVIVDPGKDPSTGVVYEPTSTAPGSYRWLNAAADWGQEKVERWRRKLAGLGYPVKEKGAFDLALRNALDAYWRNRHFFGKDIPLDHAPDAAGDPLKEAYDPVAIRNDIRSVYAQTLRVEPSEAEVQQWEKLIKTKMREIASRGATPAHAAMRAKEVFGKQFMDDPIVERSLEIQEREAAEDANTQLADSLLSIAQIVGGF